MSLLVKRSRARMSWCDLIVMRPINKHLSISLSLYIYIYIYIYTYTYTYTNNNNNNNNTTVITYNTILNNHDHHNTNSNHNMLIIRCTIILQYITYHLWGYQASPCIDQKYIEKHDKLHKHVFVVLMITIPQVFISTRNVLQKWVLSSPLLYL